MDTNAHFTLQFGTSVEQRPLTATANFSLSAKPPAGITLIIGGMHGNEPATVDLVQEFGRTHLKALKTPVALVPLANPDGHERNTRYNCRGVDLNRNFPHRWSPHSVEPSGPRPLSEPEAVALRDLILQLRPARLVSLHWALAEVEADGAHGNGLAQHMWHALTDQERAPYRLRLYDFQKPPEDYCPGSLGQWCGHDPHFANGDRPAMVTLELPYAPKSPRPHDPLPADHVQWVTKRWMEDRAGYLHDARPSVEKMLLAACEPPRQILNLGSVEKLVG